jgi:hypothetical protein
VGRIGASVDHAHQALTRNGNDTGIGGAVLDTGIDLSHPDLSPVQNGANCVTPGQLANDDQ